MGKDNQDYFKRAGRSIGPAGTPDQFKSALSQKQALLRRDQERRLPSERPVTGERPAGWLHRPEDEEPGSQARGGGHPTGGTRPSQGPQRPQARAGGQQPPRQAHPPQTRAGGQQPPQQAHPPQARTRAPQAPLPRAGGPQPPHPPAPTGKPDTGGLAALETRNQEPSLPRRPSLMSRGIQGAGREIEPREEEAPYGFGIPASEEAALGREREPHERLGHPHEGRPHAPWLESRRLQMGERMARRFPGSFRLLGLAADVVGRPIRRALDRLHTLGEIARRA